MNQRARFSRLPASIQEDLLNEYDAPKEFADRVVGCEDHQKALFRSGKHFGFFCKKCGERLSTWISHDNINDYDRENAHTDRDQIREAYRKRLRKAKQRHLERLVQIGESRANGVHDDMPAKDAPGREWHEYFTGLPKYSYEWKKGYKAYMESDWWASRRKRVLEAKGRTCRLQYEGCVGRATQVHHKSYELIGFEPLHHLVPACRECHRQLHAFKDQVAHSER